MARVFQSMRRLSLTLIRLRPRPGIPPDQRTKSGPGTGRDAPTPPSPRPRPGPRDRGILLAGGLAIPVVLGRAGIKANKHEGDGATPSGRFRLVRLWWRADRRTRPKSFLPVRRIAPDLAWCENPSDRRYNRPFHRSA